jgi:hypothetical protein
MSGGGERIDFISAGNACLGDEQLSSARSQQSQ